MPSVPRKPLLLYLSTTNFAMGALLTQCLEESQKENTIYYLSKKVSGYEEKYSSLEKRLALL
jgi:hypothetical protein